MKHITSSIFIIILLIAGMGSATTIELERAIDLRDGPGSGGVSELS